MTAALDVKTEALTTR